VLEVEDGALPRGMQSLNFRYAVNFNQRYAMRGHVQFERYGSVRIEDETHLRTAYRYVARNPVEARLCASPADWPWSSYGAAVGLAEPHAFVDPKRVLRCFGEIDELASARLRDFVEDS
jgi:REP-associated tyrosine transposase